MTFGRRLVFDPTVGLEATATILLDEVLVFPAAGQ